MNTTIGMILLAASWVLFLVTALWLRPRVPAGVTDVLVALSGVGVGIGGLLLLDDVTVASWIAAPLLLAVAGVVHVRALFAGSGPLRT
ncbi:MAG TPA: hypothetical protein VK646_10005 [Actinomycetota bacterium]|nr:hypothetical protein [Actinomycetota bacterium]